MIELNKTPVRTARNFNINSINIENINIPMQLKTFENVKVSIESKKDIVTNCDDNINNINLKYGIHNELTYQKCNYGVKIDINSKMRNSIIIDFKFDENNRELVERIFVNAKRDTKSTIIIKYTSDEDFEYFHNGSIEVKAENNAEVNIIFVNLLNIRSNNFLAIQNFIEDEAKVNSCIIDLGGKNSISNYYTNIIGENASNNLNTIYLGKENQILDLNYIAELYGKNSFVNFEVQGALKDEARKHFKGTIDFKKGCKRAKGNENEACMLLSDRARSLSLPMLLCSEEEIEGNHSTSSGKIGQKELFYIMSRGFEEKEAMKLMVKAKFNKILESIKNEELKNEIIYEIDKRLD